MCGKGFEMKKILAKREATLLIAILIVAAITTVINPQFLTPFNLINIISTNAANAIMAVGMTAVLIVGGIDISVSAQLVTVGVLAGKLMQMQVLNVFTMFLAFFIIGGLLGGVNGTLVSKPNLPPIIVSLAMNWRQRFWPEEAAKSTARLSVCSSSPYWGTGLTSTRYLP